jgi:uncharacterized membrane protein YjgN (DUF898 family)
MSTGVFINESDEAVITCPNCHRTKLTSITQFRHHHRPLRIKCVCGQAFTISLDDEEQDTYTFDDDAQATTVIPAYTTPAPGSSSTLHAQHLSFHGTGGSLFGIYIVNQLLSLCTVGIYKFWAKTKVRHYLLSQTDFAGDRFAYHGTGKELASGWGKAFLIFFLPLIIVTQLQNFMGPRLSGIVELLQLGVALVFIPVAMVNSRRYRLSRISWRGIRFLFRGRVVDFMRLFLSGIGLTVITLGLYYPIFAVKRCAFMTANSYFGNQTCRFDGEPKALFRPFLLAYLLAIPTVGLYWFWFLAQKQRYLWGHTSLASARFRSTVTGKELLVLHLTNALLLFGTFGLALPWVKVRNIHFTYKHLKIEGPLDLEAIQQEPQGASATGEGLASFFDFLDAGFDLG